MSGGREAGSSAPLGATPLPNGVNFSLFSRHATGVQLLLFDGVDDTKAARVVRLDPSVNRTYHYWHVFVPSLRPGQLYAYRAEGPFDPPGGLRFDPTKVLLDPYGRGVMVPESYSRHAARGPGDNAGTAMKSVVVDVSAYDWEGDAPLCRPSSQTIVYEMHVGGFTRHYQGRPVSVFTALRAVTSAPNNTDRRRWVREPEWQQFQARSATCLAAR